MLGNDVVDLADAGGRHPRFDARVFTPAERSLIAADARRRSVLWAAKESAYKAARKADAHTVFSPAGFVVHLADDRHATVIAGDRRFAVSLSYGDGFVHAVAQAAEDHAVDVRTAVDMRGDGEDESAAVRRLALAALAPVAGDGLAIVRHGRIPALTRAGRPLAADLSLSHHGRFVAFACVLG